MPHVHHRQYAMMRPGPVTPPPTGASSSYVATHYVVPYASASGSPANDYVDSGATVWANAASEGTPCNFGTALARATAGNNVRVWLGIYLGPQTGNRFIPSFAPANSGTVSNPLIFFAPYPAATNYGSPSLYTEVRKIGVAGGTNCPVLGVTNKNYVIFDGFYADEDYNYAAPNGGIFLLQLTTGPALRRVAIRRSTGASYPAGYNGNAIYLEATIDAVITDSLLSGHATSQGNIHNDSNNEIYNSANYLVENNTFDGHNVGFFCKENDAGSPYVTSGTVRYNRFLNGRRHIEIQQGVTNVVHNNLLYSMSQSGDSAIVMDAGPNRGNEDLNFHHNTIVINSTNTGFQIEPTIFIVTSDFKDNIIYGSAGATGYMIQSVGASVNWSWADWTMNYNNYYNGGTLTFVDDDGSTVSGIANWRTTSGEDANTITTDPQFVDAANFNFKLNAGSPALTASSTGGPVGCYITGDEEIGVRANPIY